jgi:hypothetical protein
MPLEGIHVEVTRPASEDDRRTSDTTAAGQVNFPGLAAGTYRVRFSGDDVIALEREATLRAGGITTLQITLNAAPQKKATAPAPAAAPAPPAAGPVGSPQWGSLNDLAKKAVSSKPQPHDLLLACSGNTRSTLLLLNEDQPQRLYADAESDYYVLEGQGAIRIGDRDGAVSTGSFVSVPRGQPFSIMVSRKGNKPLVMLWVLSGERCETAR